MAESIHIKTFESNRSKLGQEIKNLENQYDRSFEGTDDPEPLMNTITSIFKNIENIRTFLGKNKFEQLSRNRFVCQTAYNALSKKMGNDVDLAGQFYECAQSFKYQVQEIQTSLDATEDPDQDKKLPEDRRSVS